MLNKIMNLFFPSDRVRKERELHDKMVDILKQTINTPLIDEKKTEYYHNPEFGYTAAYSPLNRKELNELSFCLLNILSDPDKYQQRFNQLYDEYDDFMYIYKSEFKLQLGWAFLNPKDVFYNKTIGRELSKKRITILNFHIKSIELIDDKLLIHFFNDDININKIREFDSVNVFLEIKPGRKIPWLIDVDFY